MLTVRTASCAGILARVLRWIYTGVKKLVRI
jgi:hypothetical protein